ncbi:hypothetical protein TVAG_032640 [Trichomonas vaginalis G3]|uniref:Uncharacterized protein n=1 Tax=Trichomonas vaginalis (strain ATCC PRA-98 / G3) TaxID=412133 RepID=A2FMH9_TRIV3|nr:glycoprotein 38 family [Trichomonas vaginalis G3]EAX93878.1 hypothetical protein TVAG_032640 [Trichomonas vaginalis G3]KAI5541524.1 glycoprotein 38 family [Trichomonas vaginalis G3]|eukprot:XP_001306808.1 hypothetical protein [Trichomonas vaginalis G3]
MLSLLSTICIESLTTDLSECIYQDFIDLSQRVSGSFKVQIEKGGKLCYIGTYLIAGLSDYQVTTRFPDKTGKYGEEQTFNNPFIISHTTPIKEYYLPLSKVKCSNPESTCNVQILPILPHVEGKTTIRFVNTPLNLNIDLHHHSVFSTMKKFNKEVRYSMEFTSTKDADRSNGNLKVNMESFYLIGNSRKRITLTKSERDKYTFPTFADLAEVGSKTFPANELILPLDPRKLINDIFNLDDPPAEGAHTRVTSHAYLDGNYTLDVEPVPEAAEGEDDKVSYFKDDKEYNLTQYSTVQTKEEAYQYTLTTQNSNGQPPEKKSDDNQTPKEPTRTPESPNDLKENNSKLGGGAIAGIAIAIVAIITIAALVGFFVYRKKQNKEKSSSSNKNDDEEAKV